MIQQDEHLLSVLRYERETPLRPGWSKRAQDGNGSSLHARLQGPRRFASFLTTGRSIARENWDRAGESPADPTPRKPRSSSSSAAAVRWVMQKWLQRMSGNTI